MVGSEDRAASATSPISSWVGRGAPCISSEGGVETRGRVAALWPISPSLASLLWISAAVDCPSALLSMSGVGPESPGCPEITSLDGRAIKGVELRVRQRTSMESR